LEEETISSSTIRLKLTMTLTYDLFPLKNVTAGSQIGPLSESQYA